MTTKLLTPTQKEKHEAEKNLLSKVHNIILTKRKQDAEERKAHIADLKAMGLWEVEA